MLKDTSNFSLTKSLINKSIAELPIIGTSQRGKPIKINTWSSSIRWNETKATPLDSSEKFTTLSPGEAEPKRRKVYSVLLKISINVYNTVKNIINS